MADISSRFKGFPWFNPLTHRVLIGGAGGIGSWTAFFLARAEFIVTLQDFDRVERHNRGGQLFKYRDIGEYKVDAIKSTIEIFSDVSINVIKSKVTEGSPTHHIYISAFDNMEARQNAFKNWKNRYQGRHDVFDIKPIFIDGRLLGEQLQIFCVTEEHIEDYETNQLFDSSAIPENTVSCSTKQTSHSAAMIATHIMGFLTNHVANCVDEDSFREVPYYYEYLIPANLTIDEP